MSTAVPGSRWGRRLTAVAAASAIGIAGVSCGEKDEPELTTPSVSVPTTPTAPATPTTTVPGTPTQPAP
ncbi:MAG: hypothetical protein ACRDL6_12790 [Solirubrobacterales bacterium]